MGSPTLLGLVKARGVRCDASAPIQHRGPQVELEDRRADLAPGTTTWTSKLNLPGGGGNTTDYDVALTVGGVTAVVFTKPLCANSVAMAFGATSSPTGAWTSATQISPCDPAGIRGEADPPALGIAADGTAIAAWSHDTASGGKIQVATGRRVGRVCQAVSRRNRSKKPCTRLRKVGAFAHQSAVGPNSKKFSGKVGTRALRPGRYRATLVAKDPAGNTSAARRLNFRVVRR